MSETYREKFGLKNPPSGTPVQIKKMAGIEWYIRWPDCNDDENIIAGWMKNKSEAIALCKKHGWVLK